jgi:FlgD Ig-like domain
VAAWYRWFAVFGVVALVAVGFAYRGQILKLKFSSSSGGTTVPLLGSSVLSGPDLAADTKTFGRMPIVRVYYPGLPSSNAWSGGLAGANHSAVVVSFKALPQNILSGADDAALRHFFDTAPTGHPIYYSYYHEPEDNIARGEFSLSGYKAAWAHVVQLANQAHNPALHSTLILMSWDLVPASHRYWKNYLPGGHIIRVLGWDAYPTGSATNVHPVLQPASGFMGPAIAASKSVGLPYGFPEFGLSTARGRPGWLQSVGSYIMHSGALFASYFNGNTQYPTLRLTDSASQAVWRGFVTESRNGAPTPNPTPSPRPTPSHSSSPPPAGLKVSGLKLSSATVSAGAQKAATLSFMLSQHADVTVCVLNSSGRIVRTMARPLARAGTNKVFYLAYRRAGHRLTAGHYTVLVVAANARGSSSRSAAVTITP